MSAPTVHETDICLIGSGITAAMMAEHLAEHTKQHILVVEAGTQRVVIEVACTAVVPTKTVWPTGIRRWCRIAHAGNTPVDR